MPKQAFIIIYILRFITLFDTYDYNYQIYFSFDPLLIYNLKISINYYKYKNPKKQTNDL